MSILGNLIKGNGSNKLVKTPQVYSNSDFLGTTDVKLIAGGGFQKIAALTVSPQQWICWGADDKNGSSKAAGLPMYMKLMNTLMVQIQGKVRFFISDAQEFDKKMILEESTERLAASIYDRSLAPLMPEDGRYVGQDKKLIIELNPRITADATLDVDATDTFLSLPVTCQSERLD